MAEVSISAFAADMFHLERDLQIIQQSGADFIHVDVMDGHFVPNISFGYSILKDVSKVTDMYLDMEKELPGPVVQTNDELIDALRHLDEVTEQYRERYERFYDKFCHIDDGNAAERVVQAVFGGR